MQITKKNKMVVPDTSVLVNRKLSFIIESGDLDGAKILIPRFVVDELQAQASRGRDTGFEGLEEIKKIRDLCKKHKITLSFEGRRPTMEEINLAKKGRIDALIRDVAAKEGATLITSDYVQALVGEAEGMSVKHIQHEVFDKRIRIEEFFTPDTQSVHLKTGIVPVAKKGKPGDVKIFKIRKEPMSEKELKGIINQIMSKAHRDPDSFIEIGKQGASVIQMGNYRIAITRPPFSDALEVTAVRPIAKVSLDDYKLHEELKNRILSKSQGIMIAGPPGSGKSTFAASVAEFLSNMGMIVKTFEQPRDLQVGPEITQYAPLEGDWEKTAEMLLLVRPDYTIFDEIRKTKDFRVFGDMRLAGVGMIGVIHSNDPVSAIQRFIGRMELGIIPHVIDTVICIKAGKIEKVLEISLIVKIPTGMEDQDLARPVVEIRDFETKNLEYEIYTYGEENVIIPVSEEQETPLRKLAIKAVHDEMNKWDKNAQVEFLSDNRILVKVKNDVIPKLIGKGGKTIEEVEKRLGIHISVEPIEATMKHEIPFGLEETGAYFTLKIDNKFTGNQVDVYKNREFVFSPTVGKNGQISVKKNSDLGKRILQAVAEKKLKIFV